MKKRFLVILVLIPIMVEYANTNVNAASIVVLDHAFAKNYHWTGNGHIALVNKTSTFTQDDTQVYSYVQATFYSANLTWQWYDPAGQLQQTYSFNADCIATPCDTISGLRIGGTTLAGKIGRWRVDFLADGSLLFSDYFQLTPIVTQENYWNIIVTQSSNSPSNGSLRVIIHPSNSTWSHYRLYMPYAQNVTAYDYATMQPLNLTIDKDRGVVVNFGRPRPDGYSFILKFNLPYVAEGLGGGNYLLSWREYPWERYNDVHTIPESFSVTLPNQTQLLDVVGYNSMDLRYNVTGDNLALTENITGQPFGWTIVYRDTAYAPNSNSPSTGPLSGPNSVRMLPILPISVGGLSVWAAVMSVFLLTASELISPIYSRGGYGILINRRRLRLVALLLVVIFMITIAYQLAPTTTIQR
ncbi:MAG TPA: hypothetical protein VLV18_02740 [Terriglobales bacterium]|nr:hypothetical protein [Terriglobales bacterium]